MMRTTILLLVALLGSAAAFTVSPGSPLKTVRVATVPSVVTTALNMFNADDDDKTKAAPSALQVTEETKPDSSDITAAPVAITTDEKPQAKAVYKNLARGGQMEEVQWTDPAMSANTNPFQMSWWAYLLFGFPFVLLLNDAFHFLPTEGPLAFLTKI